MKIKEIVTVHDGAISLAAPSSGTGLIVRIELPKSRSAGFASTGRTS